MLHHPGLIAWLMFGFIAFMATYSFSHTWTNHRKYIPLFALVIILAGPLALLLVFIPTEIVQRWAQVGRDWLDKYDR